MSRFDTCHSDTLYSTFVDLFAYDFICFHVKLSKYMIQAIIQNIKTGICVEKQCNNLNSKKLPSMMLVLLRPLVQFITLPTECSPSKC